MAERISLPDEHRRMLLDIAALSGRPVMNCRQPSMKVEARNTHEGIWKDSWKMPAMKKYCWHIF